MRSVNFRSNHLKYSNYSFQFVLYFLVNLLVTPAIFPTNENIDPCSEIKLRIQNPKEYQKDLFDLYEFERNQIMIRMRKHLPKIEEFRTIIEQSDFEGSIYFQYRNHGEKLWRDLPSPDLPTYFSFAKSSGHLKILEQFIHPKYRELGLSKLATITLLKTYPNTKSFAANLVEINAASFLTSLLDRQISETSQREKTNQFLTNSDYESKINELFITRLLHPKTPAEIDQLRNDIIRTYMNHTPAGRIRSSLGFRNIDEITINFNSKDSEYWIAVIVNKGTSTVNHEVRITVDFTNTSFSKKITLSPSDPQH